MARKKTVHLSPKNEEALKEFIKYIRATRSKNKGTLKTYYYSVQRVLNIAGKDYNKIRVKDLHEVFSQIDGASCELIKTKFKIFLEWKKMDKLAYSIKINYVEFKKPTKSHEDVLSPEEIQKFINTPLELRDRALIELYIASGCRREEINNLLIGDIEITETIIWLHINHGKTGNRKIPLVADPNIASAIYPKNFVIFYQNHPFGDKPTKALFFSLSKSNRGSALNKGSINGIIDRMYKKSGIERRITPHILRHTSATYDGLALSEQDMCLKYGWRPGSDMVKRYCHANVQHLGDYLLKKAGLTDEKVKEQTICPKCKAVNNIGAERCSNCNFILDRELAMKEDEQRENRDRAIQDKIKEYEQRFSRIEDNLGISLNPETKRTQNHIDLVESLAPLLYKLAKGKEGNPEQIEKIKKVFREVTPEVLQNVNELPTAEEKLNPDIVSNIIQNKLKQKVTK